jgi:hypothetical protein
MTPKEKAIEMHNKFLNCKDFSNSYFVIPIDEDATQCALIAVDELIKETGKKYWYDVKQEIEDI